MAAKKAPSSPSRHPVLSAFKWVLVASIWGGLALAVVAAVFAYQLPDPSQAIRDPRRASITLLANDGSVIAQYGDYKGDPVTFEAIPPHLIQAVVAIEDRRFYSHFGVDPIGLMRAFAVNAWHMRIVQGGSTLSQQLAKNLFLTADRNIQRKIKEALLALWLEHRFTKDQILTAYLNRVYLGAGAYGIEAASQLYFGKQVKDLGLYESAMIAGLLKAPSRYSPLSSPELAEERTRIVLAAMHDIGYITEKQKTDFQGVRVQNGKSVQQMAEARYFADWAINRIDGYLGTTEKDIIVQTTLDPGLQKQITQMLRSKILGAQGAYNVSQGALVMMKTDGAILSMVGGVSYDNSQFNRASQAQRQPGSAFKPIVYLAALESGMGPGANVEDAPIDFGKYNPENLDSKYHGTVTLSEALVKSLNTAAVRVLRKTGVGETIATARKLGVTSDLRHDLSLALGSSEMNLVELTKVYAAFANGGHVTEPYAITEIRDNQGRVLYHRPPDEMGLRVIDGANLSQLTRMLQKAVEDGTGKRADPGRPAAGKTGTSQDYRDAWFVGYTADYVAGVWMGNDDNASMSGVTGGTLPAELWREAMVLAHKGKPERSLQTGAPISRFSDLMNRLGGGY